MPKIFLNSLLLLLILVACTQCDTPGEPLAMVTYENAKPGSVALDTVLSPNVYFTTECSE